MGLFSVILGSSYLVLTYQTPRASIGSPYAPLIFPGMIGLGLLALGIAILCVDRKKASSGDVPKKGKEKDPGYWKLVVGTVVLCVAYGFVFERLGYIFSTLLFLFGLLSVINETKRWKQNIIVTFIFTFSLWLVFVKAFQISLPTFTQGGIF